MQRSFRVEVYSGNATYFKAGFDLTSLTAPKLPHAGSMLSTFRQVARINGKNQAVSKVLIYQLRIESEPIEGTLEISAVSTFRHATVTGKVRKIMATTDAQPEGNYTGRKLVWD